MSKKRLGSGDKVKLSVRGLRLQLNFRKAYIPCNNWRKALSRNEKDTYLVYNIFRISGTTYVRLGNLYRKGPFRFLKRKKGPLTGYVVKRDWIKFAK